MNQTTTKYVLGIIAVFVALVLVKHVYAAWTGPTQAPPGGNVAAPINVSGVDQTKAGSLRVGDILLNKNGNINATAFLYTSDRRLKKDIVPLSDNTLKNIFQLQGVSFKWEESGKQDIGLIAQDVEKVYPELVITNELTGYKSIQYAGIIAPLIETVKQQQERINALEARIEYLEI